MEKNERKWRWLRICAWAAMVLGSVHEVAAGFIFPAVAGQLKSGDRGAFLYVFLATGAGLIFTGWVLRYTISGLRNTEAWAKPLAFGCALFITLLGVGGVVAMSDNPFAYVGLVLGIASLVLCLI